MSENLRIDLHTHSIFSDGELLPSELARRADVLGHKALAITDHVDASNIQVASQIAEAVNDIRDNWDINLIPGVEITHVPIEVIDKLANNNGLISVEDRLSDNSDFGSSDYFSDEELDEEEEEESDIQENCNHDENYNIFSSRKFIYDNY